MNWKIAKVLLLSVVGLATLITAADTTRRRPLEPLRAAEILPADCMVYVRFKDLSRQIAQWQASPVSKRYFKSKSFELWSRRHLALKLLERLSALERSMQEVPTLDAIKATIRGEAELGIYDIGNTQFVLVSRPSAGTSTLGRLLSQKNFEQRKSPAGRVYFCGLPVGDFQICWAVADGRLIVASRESLMLETLANLDSGAEGTLAKDPVYADTMQGEFHDIVVWLNLAKVNRDWYFRHYWIYRNFDELSSIRAGVIDLQMTASAFIERRSYLVDKGQASATFSADDLRLVTSLAPENIFGYQAEVMQKGEYVDRFEDLLFEPEVFAKKRHKTLDAYSNYANYAAEQTFSYQTSDEEPSDSDEEYDDYYYRLDESKNYHTRLGQIYNVAIDDPFAADTDQVDREDFWREKALERRNALNSMLEEGLAQASPLLALRFAEPAFEEPFVYFQRALVMRLAYPERFVRDKFEGALERMLRYHIVATSSASMPTWRNRGEIRELVFPLVGRGISYVLRNDLLIVTNSSDYTSRLLMPRSTQIIPELVSERVSSYRVVRPAKGRASFTKLFERLDSDAVRATTKPGEAAEEDDEDVEEPKKADSIDISETFFSGNLGSLLEVVKNVSEITFEVSRSSERLQETVVYHFDIRGQRR